MLLQSEIFCVKDVGLQSIHYTENGYFPEIEYPKNYTYIPYYLSLGKII